jgi:hypothetical protein
VERRDSIKPGVKRSGTPGFVSVRVKAHEVGDSLIAALALSHAARAHFDCVS